MIQIMNLIDQALELSSGERFSENDARQCISKLALVLKMLVNHMKCEEGDTK